MPRQTSNELACPCELSNSPCLHLTAESDSAVFTSTPDGSNARTTLQIRRIRIWRVTGTGSACRAVTPQTFRMDLRGGVCWRRLHNIDHRQRSRVKGLWEIHRLGRSVGGDDCAGIQRRYTLSLCTFGCRLRRGQCRVRAGFRVRSRVQFCAQAADDRFNAVGEEVAAAESGELRE
jgi:hypothetical protein